ncbi:5037_t:CDS:2 [Paraglomus occultum]|uniref:5037_t:CDS:1 n=1 Tax=Paraglomus occultum TaxID=144539 RepID=A0A9N9AN28_9GLOM|nr:5037_t:CDS:2 [Paraglomus occultum]
MNCDSSAATSTQFTKQEQEETLWSNPSTPSDISLPHTPITKTEEDYSVYHVPRGYDVVLVPKLADQTSIPDSNPAVSATADSGLSDCDSYSSTCSKPRKADKNYIPRPKNCFMAYREHIKEKFLAENPGMNNKVVSVLAANLWNNEPEEVKEFWRERAKQLKIEHKLKYPDYKFKPQKKKQNIKSPNTPKSVKTVRKKTGSDSVNMMYTDGYGSEDNKLVYPLTLDAVSDEQEEYYIQHLHKKALFGHYRASSVDSVSSWTSDSTASTPLLSPFVGSPASLSPPTFHMTSQYGRSPSALRYEAGKSLDNYNNQSDLLLSSHNLAMSQSMLGEVDQLNHMYNQLDVNAHATLPVDDGFVLDSAPYESSSLRTANFLQQPHCSSSQTEMSSTDYDLMAMGQYGLMEEAENYVVGYNGSGDHYLVYNSPFDLSAAENASSIAQYATSEQRLTDFQEGLRQQQLKLQELMN